MDNKKKIALLTNHDDDVYCFRKELIENLVNEGYKVVISCPSGPKLALMPKSSEIEYRNIYIDRRGTNPIKDLKLFLQYCSFMWRVRPDIVLCYTAKPNVYGSIAAKLWNIPYINNVTGFGSVLTKKRLMKKFILWLFKFAYNQASCVMFQNSTNMQLAQDMGMVKGKKRLIPGSGVALKRYPLQPYPDGGNGVNGEPVRFNYFGRILREKGIDDYIECARRIKKQYPNTEFNICGFIEPTEKHYEKELKNLQEQGTVIYHGNQNDVRPFIARAHALIHPSTYGEGMSNVLLENASSGRPLITTDNHGCCEAVDDGKNGFIYHGGEVNDLVDIIKKFLLIPNNERREMGLFGRHKMEHQFDRQIVVKAYLAEIFNALQEI
jgi:galacturonosyltransferase